MSYALGNIIYDTPVGTLGAGGAAIANDGLSLNGAGTTIQLGGPLGSAAAANLLDNREIPLNSFAILFSGFSGTSRILWKEAGAGENNNIHLLGQDISANEIFRLNYGGDVAGDHGFIAIGAHAAQNVTGPGASGVVIGWRAYQAAGAVAMSHINIVGYEAGFNVSTADFLSLFGGDAGFNITTGGGHAAFGTSSLFNVTTGTNNSAFGEASGQGFNGASSFNVAIGANAGNWVGAVGTNGNGNIIIGSGAFNTNNQFATGGLISIGQNTGNQNFATGTNDILIGTAIVLSANTTNTTVLGAGITIGINNVAVIGRADQDVIIGATTGIVDTGSKLQVLGSIGLPTNTSAVSFSLDATMHTVFLTAAGLVVTLPTAAAGTKRIYAIVNQAGASTTSINYINKSGVGVNTLAANSATWIQSDGTNWNQIN